MPIPTYTKADLSKFTGRPVVAFTEYSEEALAQAKLLFKLGTCLKEMPEDEDYAELVRNAILSMADSIFLSKRFAQAKASPFSSETIGSYSYSKAAKAVTSGKETGIMWFDLAVSTLGVCDLEDRFSWGGGIEVFEHDAAFTAGSGNNLRMLSPQDIDVSRRYGFDPAPGYQTAAAAPVSTASVAGSPVSDSPVIEDNPPMDRSATNPLSSHWIPAE